MLHKINFVFNHITCRISTIVFLILLKNVSTIGYQGGDTHRLAKRMDLESCLGQFDVHRNTIIRTGESQAIGGKYLQGLELNTLEECQRLCCETDGCDVYIFEDKNDGYCYLFECGPPENFHCKFTRHANYTSAVLTPTRHISPDPTTPRTLPHIPSLNISQQERELTNLKMRPEKGKATTMSPLTGIPLISTSAVASFLPEIPVKAPTSNITCGRFQFKCHSGECIAVYNACDGIPQCEDGSDEGPECRGASALNSAAAAKSSLTNADITGHTSNVEIDNTNNPKQIQSGQIGPQFQQQQQHSLITPPLINNREDSLAWANRKIVDAQQNEADRNSHIFNHKGGIQVPTNGIVPFPNANIGPVYAPIPREIFLPQPKGASPFRSQNLQPQAPHIIVPSNYDWPQTQGGQPVPFQGPAYIINEPQPQLTAPLLPKPITPIGSELTNVAAAQENANIAKALPNPKSALSPSTVKTKNKLSPPDSPSLKKLNVGSDEDYVDYDDGKPTEPPKKKQRKHKKSKTKSADKTEDKKSTSKNLEHKMEASLQEQYKQIHSNLEMEYIDHDGLSERPGGAVLSLTLGLLVTAALGILIGCRMRTVGRRVRRLGGKAPYSHDADFLVNGMYL